MVHDLVNEVRHRVEREKAFLVAKQPPEPPEHADIGVVVQLNWVSLSAPLRAERLPIAVQTVRMVWVQPLLPEPLPVRPVFDGELEEFRHGFVVLEIAAYDAPRIGCYNEVLFFPDNGSLDSGAWTAVHGYDLRGLIRIEGRSMVGDGVGLPLPLPTGPGRFPRAPMEPEGRAVHGLALEARDESLPVGHRFLHCGSGAG